MKSVHIADVNDDCLQHILEELSLEDLLNVADTNKQLSRVAKLVYKKKYGQKRVQMLFCYQSMDSDTISINNFSSCLKLMRCFGTSISKLSISYFNIPGPKRIKLNEYLNVYCAAHLTDLEYNSGSLSYLTREFPKVVNLSFSDLDLKHERNDISTCFPNVQVLKLFKWYDNDSIVAHLPRLVRLEVFFNVNTLDNITNCLRMNQQLRNLKVRSGFGLNFLRAISECSQLDSLHLSLHRSMTSQIPITFSTNNEIQFKSVEKLKISGESLELLVSFNITLVFDQLEEIEIYEDLTQNAIEFISKHTSVSKVTLTCVLNSDHFPMSKLAKALPPSVKHVRINWNLSLDVAVGFVNKSKSLKSFTFKICKLTFNLNDLKKRLGNEWQWSIEYNDIKFQR